MFDSSWGRYIFFPASAPNALGAQYVLRLEGLANFFWGRSPPELANPPIFFQNMIPLGGR